jgi:hypothetical protein
MSKRKAKRQGGAKVEATPPITEEDMLKDEIKQTEQLLAEKDRELAQIQKDLGEKSLIAEESKLAEKLRAKWDVEMELRDQIEDAQSVVDHQTRLVERITNATLAASESKSPTDLAYVEQLEGELKEAEQEHGDLTDAQEKLDKLEASLERVKRQSARLHADRDWILAMLGIIRSKIGEVTDTSAKVAQLKRSLMVSQMSARDVERKEEEIFKRKVILLEDDRQVKKLIDELTDSIKRDKARKKVLEDALELTAEETDELKAIRKSIKADQKSLKIMKTELEAIRVQHTQVNNQLDEWREIKREKMEAEKESKVELPAKPDTLPLPQFDIAAMVRATEVARKAAKKQDKPDPHPPKVDPKTKRKYQFIGRVGEMSDGLKVKEASKSEWDIKVEKVGEKFELWAAKK